MDNLNKLLKYLINSEEMEKIAKSADVSIEVVQSACFDVFGKLIPTDFTRSEEGKIEKKDLAAITSNFNALLSSNNLKMLVAQIALKNNIDNAKCGVVVKEILVIVRDKLKYMTAVKKEPVKQEVKPEPVEEEVKQEIKHESVDNDVEIFKEKRRSRLIKQEEVEIKPQSEELNNEKEADDEYEEDLGKKEKVVLSIVALALLAVIIVIVVILIKTLKG